MVSDGSRGGKRRESEHPGSVFPKDHTLAWELPVQEF